MILGCLGQQWYLLYSAKLAYAMAAMRATARQPVLTGGWCLIVCSAHSYQSALLF